MTTPPTGPAPTWSLADFDFDLPPELIAQHPSAQRSAARLLDALQRPPADRTVSHLPELLRPSDLLIFNDTQVIKARLWGHKASGGQVEVLIERVLLAHESSDGSAHEVIAHLRVSKKPATGTRLHISGGLSQGGFDAIFLGRWPQPQGPLFHLRLQGPSPEQTPYDLMDRYGHVPLPPYITHSDSAQDEQRYQTIFARVPGAVAAPTAALHFDQALLHALQTRGIPTAHLTLHVGAGTFAPVKTPRISEHLMHHERYDIPPSTILAIARCRAAGGRVLAVGTTTTRALESWAQTGQTRGQTNIFITPGFQFQVVDLLLTNFHLPKSTLMMLVSAFAGHPLIMSLYQHAIAQRYRFFSYGDAMLLQKHPATPAPVTP